MALAAGGAPLSIAAGVREFARATPAATAVIDGDRRQSYAELDERSSRLAQALLAGGLGPGDPVAVLLGNRLEYCEIAAGLAKAGLPLVPLNPRMTGPEVDYIVGHSGARALVLDEALSGAAASSAGALDRVLSIGGESLGPAYEAALADAPARDPHLVVDETAAVLRRLHLGDHRTARRVC